MCYAVHRSRPRGPALLKASTSTLRGSRSRLRALSPPASSPHHCFGSQVRHPGKRFPTTFRLVSLPHSPRINFVNTNGIRSAHYCCTEGVGGRSRCRRATTRRRKTTGPHVTEAKRGGNSLEERPTFGCGKFHEKEFRWPRVDVIYLSDSLRPETSFPKDAS